jgi:excinuclease UvrABC ATPase subunit
LLGFPAKNGNTVVVTGHNPDVIRAVAFLTDIEPGEGEAGREIMATGMSEVVAAVLENYTK